MRHITHVVSLTKTCEACPAQWDGITDTGDYVYVRYRWGFLTIDVDNKRVESKQLGHELDGSLNLSQLRKATAKHFTWPEAESVTF